jgi:hypothetical protein
MRGQCEARTNSNARADSCGGHVAAAPSYALSDRKECTYPAAASFWMTVFAIVLAVWGMNRPLWVSGCQLRVLRVERSNEQESIQGSAEGCGKELGMLAVESFLRGGVARFSLVGRRLDKY